jgi:hypothetical protein
MAKKKNKLKGTPTVASSLLVASAGGPSALLTASEVKRNLNDVLGKDPQLKTVNTRSDTGSPAVKKRAQPQTADEDMEALEDNQESLEDADRLDLDNSEIVEESPELSESSPDTQPHSLEPELVLLVTQSTESTDKMVTPSPPPGSPPVACSCNGGNG